MEDLRQLVQQLAEARRQYDQDRLVVDKLEADFKADHRDLLEAMDQTKTLRDDIEGEIRLRQYSGADKTPAPGLIVKMITTVSYTPSTALGWAIENQHHNLLTLNAKAFEQVAKGLRLDFVIIGAVPQVTIARDLTEATAQIAMEQAAEAVVLARSEALTALGYGPCTEALCGKQDVTGFFEKAVEAVKA